MSLIHFIRLLLKNWKLLLLVPLAMAISIYYFTRNEKKTFSSETVVYTGIASGYTLNGSNKADYFETSNAFDNLLNIIDSRETKQEVSLKLLAEHLSIKKHDPAVMEWGSFDELRKLVPDSVRNILVKENVDSTFSALETFMQKTEGNVIYNIINSDNALYSINALRSIKASRLNSSDLIKISYSTQDAAVCKRTLELLEETFMRKHKALREGQTETVITYFENETKKSFARLDSAEQMFLDFNRNNDIINYYEQTKAVAGAREDLFALNHTLEMDRMANQDALGKIDNELRDRAKQSMYGSKVITQRNQLSDIYGKIAVFETFSQTDPSNKKIIDSLKGVASSIENNLRSAVDDLYVQTTTPGGIPSKDMLEEWIKTTISYEQSKARLTVMDKRKKEFDEEYSKFAPLGAMLQKIERQISVAEQEYLEMVHGLNLARLTQQNNELTSKLTVIDPPYLPLKANPSTRIVMVAGGFMAGFIVILSLLLTRFLIDKSLKEPARASKITGLKILGIYPLLKEQNDVLQKAAMRLLQQTLSVTDTTRQHINIGFISIENKEGKSTIINILNAGFKQINTSNEIVQWPAENHTGSARINMIEFPALDHYIYTAGTLPKLDNLFIVCRANRIWTKVDQELLNNFSKACGIKANIILNGVELDFAEEYIGEAPKKRTMIRSLFKRMMKFEFGNKKYLVKTKMRTGF